MPPTHTIHNVLLFSTLAGAFSENFVHVICTHPLIKTDYSEEVQKYNGDVHKITFALSSQIESII